MKTHMIGWSLLVALGTSIAVSTADEPQQGQMPQPTKEHEWLKKLEGEWAIQGECTDPNGATKQIKGSESNELLGGFWSIGRVEAEGDQPMKGIFTLGFDDEKKKYVATWVDSTHGTLWRYEGQLDSGGKVLTLEGEGRCPIEGMIKVKEIIEVQGPDKRTFTSQREKDGQWRTMLSLSYTRKSPENPQ